MKVTKYPQSCLLLEKYGKRIVIDPGIFFTQEFSLSDLGKIEAVLYTHQHPDHYDPDLAKQFMSSGVQLYGNADVSTLIGEGVITVNSGTAFSVAGFDILPHDLPHCRTIELPAPPNTGYIIDSNFFHPGDGIETNGVKVKNLALPIVGPDISFYDAVELARATEAKKIIPMHYHQKVFWANPDNFASRIKFAEVIVLQDGQSVEL